MPHLVSVLDLQPSRMSLSFHSSGAIFFQNQRIYTRRIDYKFMGNDLQLPAFDNGNLLSLIQ